MSGSGSRATDPSFRAGFTVAILTGPVHTGKTTALSAWAGRARERGLNVSGVLAPVRDGVRHLCSIATGVCHELDVSQGRERPRAADAVRIGPHVFKGSVFAWARDELDTAARAVRTQAAAWLVVDEVGPLELRGDGLEPSLGRAVRELWGAGTPGEASGTAGRREEQRAPGGGLLLVVRDRLVDRVIEHYSIDPGTVRIVSPVGLTGLIL